MLSAPPATPTDWVAVALAARLFIAFDGSTANDLGTRVFVGPCVGMVGVPGGRGPESTTLTALEERVCASERPGDRVSESLASAGKERTVKRRARAMAGLLMAIE